MQPSGLLRRQQAAGSGVPSRSLVIAARGGKPLTFMVGGLKKREKTDKNKLTKKKKKKMKRSWNKKIYMPDIVNFWRDFMFVVISDFSLTQSCQYY